MFKIFIDLSIFQEVTKNHIFSLKRISHLSRIYFQCDTKRVNGFMSPVTELSTEYNILLNKHVLLVIIGKTDHIAETSLL